MSRAFIALVCGLVVLAAIGAHQFDDLDQELHGLTMKISSK